MPPKAPRRLRRRPNARLVVHTHPPGAVGEDGLAVFRQRQAQIDLVLLDISMPKKSGLEVLRELRSISPQTRVVLFTGYAENPATSSQAQAVVHKPLQVQRFLQVIRKVIDRPINQEAQP